MIVKSIKIENLFDIFDYNIEYPKGESVLIITGPNGFGKTQVLNILYNLFNRKFLFFRNLVFNKVTVCLSNNISIKIIKKKNDLKLILLDGNKEISAPITVYVNDKTLLNNISRHLPFIDKVDEHKWVDLRTGKVKSMNEIINDYEEELPINFRNDIIKIKNDRINEILDSINVHLIREQRLFKKLNKDKSSFEGSIGNRDQTLMIETIQTYADELHDLIFARVQKLF